MKIKISKQHRPVRADIKTNKFKGNIYYSVTVTRSFLGLPIISEDITHDDDFGELVRFFQTEGQAEDYVVTELMDSYRDSVCFYVFEPFRALFPGSTNIVSTIDLTTS